MMYNQKLESVGEEGKSEIKPKRFIERFKCVSKASCLWHYGGYSVGVPPLPIPNREVKPVRADGTAYSGRVGSRRPFRLSAALEKASPQRHSLFTQVYLFGLLSYWDFSGNCYCVVLSGGLSRWFSLSMCRYDISGGIPNINTGERPRRLYSSFQVVFRGQVILSTDQILIVRGNSEEIATLTHGYSWIVWWHPK